MLVVATRFADVMLGGQNVLLAKDFSINPRISPDLISQFTFNPPASTAASWKGQSESKFGHGW